jgi:hypothetical protein
MTQDTIYTSGHNLITEILTILPSDKYRHIDQITDLTDHKLTNVINTYNCKIIVATVYKETASQADKTKKED